MEVRFAYADPPYFGYAVKFYGDKHPDAAVYDTLDGHHALITRLCSEFPDGWALSMTSGNLHDILPLCPRAARVAAWVKPFAAFKKNVTVAYAWEPVVVMGGRKRDPELPTVRDWFAESIALKKGLTGAKPARMIQWILEMLGALPDEDEIVDLFHGSGSVAEAIGLWRSNRRLFV
jgi:hypothetical protein